MKKCNTCGGTYRDVLADGLLYFHHCPPLTVAELQTGLTNKTITFGPVVAAQLAAAGLADTNNPVPAGSPTHVQQLLATLHVDRPNFRDENLPDTDPDSHGKRKSDGGGVTDLPDPKIPPGAVTI